MMKLKVGYTLEQLLEVYNKKANIPKPLTNENVGIYGLSFKLLFWYIFLKNLYVSKYSLNIKLNSCDSLTGI